MTVERLVQQFGVERTDVFIAAEGDENTVGVEEAGSDTEERYDAQLAGLIIVSADIEDDGLADEVRSAFAEFDATAVEEY